MGVTQCNAVVGRLVSVIPAEELGTDESCVFVQVVDNPFVVPKPYVMWVQPDQNMMILVDSMVCVYDRRIHPIRIQEVH